MRASVDVQSSQKTVAEATPLFCLTPVQYSAVYPIPIPLLSWIKELLLFGAKKFRHISKSYSVSWSGDGGTCRNERIDLCTQTGICMALEV